MRRSGFTLVELLVAITIIAILTGIAVGGMYAARESAREAATESLIAELSVIVSERWDAMNARRLPMSPAAMIAGDTPTRSLGFTDPRSVQQIAAVRLLNQRELQRFEFPTRYDDITTAPAWLYPDPPPPPLPPPVETTAAREAYLRLLLPTATPQFESAECLYMIVHAFRGETDPPSERHVADVDGDGMREYVDAWGMPIAFTRWPTGYRSDIQSGDPVADHDPLDVLRLEPWAFRTTPLIQSAGPDGIYDTWAVNAITAPADLGNPYFQPMGNPLPGAFFDVAGDGNDSLDNITNHVQ